MARRPDRGRSPEPRRSSPSRFTRRRRPRLLAEPVARRRPEVEPVDPSEVADHAPAVGPERRLSFEGVKDGALEKVPEGDVVVLREALQDLQDPLLDPDARLDPLDLD